MIARALDRLADLALWAVLLGVNGCIAVYGGAWFGQVLIGQPRLGALLGLGNLAAAVIYRARENPNLGFRVHAYVHGYSAYSSVLLTMAGFFLLEALAGGAVALGLHLLT